MTNHLFDVVVANGDRIKCQGLCTDVRLTVQGLDIIAEFYILPLGSYEVVLGAQWLRTLGPITWAFQHLTMAFKTADQSYTWQGDDVLELKIMEADMTKKCDP